MDEVEIVRNIEDAGFIPKRRNMHYDILGDPFFREHAVPRMTAARHRKDRRRGGMPVQLLRTRLRSRTGKRLYGRRVAVVARNAQGTMHNAETAMNGAVPAPCGCSSFVGLLRFGACPMRNSAMQRRLCSLCIVHCALHRAGGAGQSSAAEGPVGPAHRAPRPSTTDGSTSWMAESGGSGKAAGMTQMSDRARPGACSADARARERAHAPRAVVSRRARFRLRPALRIGFAR